MSFSLPITWGYYPSIKSLGEIALPCCICNGNLDCTVERWRDKFHIMYIPTRIVEEKLLFTWLECGHSTEFIDEEMALAYLQSIERGEILQTPNCEDLIPITVERPWPVTWKSLLLISPLILGVGALVLFLVLSILTVIVLSIAGSLGLL
jgi:hypothetical protein